MSSVSKAKHAFQQCSLETYLAHVGPVMCAAHATSVFQREFVEVCFLGMGGECVHDQIGVVMDELLNHTGTRRCKYDNI